MRAARYSEEANTKAIASTHFGALSLSIISGHKWDLHQVIMKNRRKRRSTLKYAPGLEARKKHTISQNNTQPALTKGDAMPGSYISRTCRTVAFSQRWFGFRVPISPLLCFNVHITVFGELKFQTLLTGVHIKFKDEHTPNARPVHASSEPKSRRTRRSLRQAPSPSYTSRYTGAVETERLGSALSSSRSALREENAERS